ncbi:uncharacterized protein N7515_007995 [Penicillium bovifimosum]|uniref:Myb-like domain-containing protein n=1 Tax=Penicillium bovifimosum TaxID=126998 RepID=A0A9W9GNN7_9EURO|nr:uncharacterized protein N7515_007995 [Penicillium bovifimosum]KAJ5124170.1 hypothetical protein N7515_007995 [Penicillium bovifimosum]
MARITGSRMTRSRSREASNGLMQTKGANPEVVSGGNLLSVLPEEPSIPAPVFTVPGQVIPESPENPEGHTNVSGTTLGHGDVVPDDSQVADKIVTHLPFLQQQASLLMTLLVPPDLNPDSLAAEAKRLSESSHPHRKRLKRYVEGLTDELEDSPLSRDGKSLLNVSEARRLLSRVQLDAAITNLHMTNCAVLALNIFLPSMGTESHSQVIHELDAKFPACVMNDFAHSSTSREIGASATREATFNLALNIRTQFFIMELERRQQEPDFSPFSVLRQVFAMDLTPNEADSQDAPSSFRGFNLPGVLQDADGHLPEHLPEKFLIAVNDRFSDLQEELSEWDSVDIGSLKKAYRWRAFERDLARWICTRDKEIKDDVRRLSERQAHTSPPARRLTSVPLGTPNRRQVSTIERSVETREPSLVLGTRSPQKERAVNTASVTDEATAVNEAIAEDDATAVDEASVADEAPVASRVPGNNAFRSPALPPKRPATTSSVSSKQSLRRTSTNNYLNPFSLAVLKRRMMSCQREPPPNAESQARGSLGQVDNPGPLANGRTAKSPEIQQSPEPRYPDIGDDSTYVNHDEDLDPAHGPGSDIMTSDSPPTSARIERVSHNPRYFDSRRDGHSQRSTDLAPASRRFLDKQTNAAAVSPISQYDSQVADKEHTTLGKRPRIYDGSDLETDDEFEEDTHDVDPMRRLDKPQQSRPAAKRQRPQDSSQVEERQHLQSTLDELSRRQDHHQPKSSGVIRRAPSMESDNMTDQETTLDRSVPPPTQSRWAATNSVAAARSLKIRKTHRRWSEEEDQRLIHLMGIWGPSWATIKKQDGACPPADGGPLLESRSQVNCKDRARTLKRKYLREGRPLPPGLDKALS